ncbi:serine protease [Demequina sp. SYSU T00039]|uniref:Serine protease n=1 Tax=Demequina lignilytica TaxID=3051663 RepID=A0AAW7M1H3_9MICO|nr:MULTISPECIES: serine protease [unclassified Demequina]MDN4477086.1 serine protease [Demequina sp. SYSU T00039-1]MDN4487259.1 serine protease [Demequina sp. SYSU T00039]MDN4491510.1 serine protease [Demequina sp. SYSU T00068]
MTRTRLAASLGIGVLAVAGCAPLTPPPYTTPVPVEVSAAPAVGDGFTGAELVALRVWTTTCDAFLNGSAWMLDESHAVTNRHVVEDGAEIELTDYQGNEYHGVAAEMSLTDDLALVTIEGSFPRAATVGTEEPAPGDTLSVSGFALGGPLATVTGRYQGLIENHLDPDGAAIYSIAVEVREGNSGSPVTDEAGAVVGVIFSSDGATMGGAVSLDRLMAFLDGDTDRADAMTTCG